MDAALPRRRSHARRALIHAARRLVVLADHTKWDTVGISTIAQLDDADVLVVDDGLPQATRDMLAGRVGELLVVSTDAAAEAPVAR